MNRKMTVVMLLISLSLAMIPFSSAFSATNSLASASRQWLEVDIEPNEADSLVFSTYLPFYGLTVLRDIDIDKEGNLVAVGITDDGPYGPWNGFIIIIDPFSSEIISSNFIGGNGSDDITSVAIASDNTIYFVGDTSSPEFLNCENQMTSGSLGYVDCFLGIFNQTSSESTIHFFGGTGYDRPHSIAIDENDDVIITGRTLSTDLPVKNAYDPTYNGKSDAFVAKFIGIEEYEFLTYLGGAEDEWPYSVTSSNGLVYVGGTTNSSDMPVSIDGNGDLWGLTDGFLSILRGSEMEFGSYYGSSGGDRIKDILVDESGNLYIAGCSSVSDFMNPNFDNSIDNSLHNIAFIMKLRQEDLAMEKLHLIGGTRMDEVSKISVGPNGSLYMAMGTTSENLTCVNAQFPESSGGYDAFVAEIEMDSGRFLYSSYFGGSENEYVYSMDIYPESIICVAGATESRNLPISNAIDESFMRPLDSFIALLRVNSTLSTEFPSIPVLSLGIISGLVLVVLVLILAQRKRY